MASFGDYLRNLLEGDSRIADHKDSAEDIPVNLPEKGDVEIIPRERPAITFDHG